jgi:ribose transport system substrate-binding protein
MNRDQHDNQKGKNKMKKIFSLPIILLLLFAGCAKKQPATTATKTIGVSLLTRAHVFYKDLEEGLLTMAKQNNYDLIIASADFDLGKQTSQVEDFITRKVDAIIVCPVDSRGIGAAITKANEAKIPVFTADIAAQEGEVVCHIASDNVAGGTLAGKYLAELLKGKGKIAIIGQPTVTSVLDRTQGFKNAIAQFPDIKIVSEVNGEGVRDKAMQAASDILQAHRDLSGIFGINDDSALGALDAVMQFKRTNIVIVGYDATPPALAAILNDTPLKADVVQYPAQIGMTTIVKIKEHFDGAPVPRVVPVNVGIVDKAELIQSAMK